MKDSIFEWIATHEDKDVRLQHFIHQKLEGLHSLKQIKRAIEKSFCEVNGRREHFASTKVAPGDKITFNVAGLEIRQLPTCKFAPNRILFEDDDLIIYNKPPGIVTEEGGLLTLLQKHYSSVYSVHRLDKETSGAVIFAKSKEVQERLIDIFKERSIAKHYVAIVDGIPNKVEGVIDFPLEKTHTFEGQSLWGPAKSRSKGRKALTHWKLLEKGAKCALVICHPVTGRTHQLRVHLHSIGHPILGDALYGKQYKCEYVPSRLMLHAWKLEFTHPYGGESISVEAPVPDDFAQAQAALSLKEVKG